MLINFFLIILFAQIINCCTEISPKSLGLLCFNTITSQNLTIPNERPILEAMSRYYYESEKIRLNTIKSFDFRESEPRDPTLYSQKYLYNRILAAHLFQNYTPHSAAQICIETVIDKSACELCCRACCFCSILLSAGCSLCLSNNTTAILENTVYAMIACYPITLFVYALTQINVKPLCAKFYNNHIAHALIYQLSRNRSFEKRFKHKSPLVPQCLIMENIDILHEKTE